LSETHKPATPAAPRSSRSEFWRGVRDTLPLEIGAIPFGIIFGALAISAGISTGGTIALSLFVFAGSSQFIAGLRAVTDTDHGNEAGHANHHSQRGQGRLQSRTAKTA
jgi:hypothetical protein